MTQHETLAAALAGFQAELPKLVKDETAKVKGTTKDGRDYDRSYGYADLAQVVETVLPVLGKHGLSIMSRTVFADGMFVLEVKLLHGCGEYETAVWPLPAPGSGVGPQDVGSAMTYGRRYLTLALSGAYPGGEDDDGARAQSRADSWDTARPRQERQQPPAAPAKTEWTEAEIGELHGRIEKLPVGQAVNGYDWMASKNLHERPVQVAATGGGDDGTGPLFATATEVLAYRLADEAVKADTLAAIGLVSNYAEARGLMKILVSESTTLGEELAMARDLFGRRSAGQTAEPVRDEPEAAQSPQAD